jgi:hypothetical protein
MHATLLNCYFLAELCFGELYECSTVVTRGLIQWKALDRNFLHVVAKNSKLASIMLQLQTAS